MTLHFECLRISRDFQKSNGLTLQDYARYRHFCAHRLRRTRAAPSSDSPFLILLLQAERAWAYGMELKADYTQELKKDDGNYRLRRHVLGRMRKAAQFGAKLHEAVLAQCDERSASDAQAYAAWLAGLHAIEREEYPRALSELYLAKLIMGEGGEHDERIHDEIEPNMRLCRFKGRVEASNEREIVSATLALRGVSLNEMEKKYALGKREEESRVSSSAMGTADMVVGTPAPDQKEAVISRLTFKGNALSFPSAGTHERAVAAYAQYAALAAVPPSDIDAAYDKILLALDEVSSQCLSLPNTRDALAYTKLSLALGRTRTLLERKTGRVEAIRLLEVAVQTLEAMATMVKGELSENVLRKLVGVARAERCAAIAAVCVEDGKFAEGMAMVERAEKYEKEYTAVIIKDHKDNSKDSNKDSKRAVEQEVGLSQEQVGAWAESVSTRVKKERIFLAAKYAVFLERGEKAGSVEDVLLEELKKKSKTKTDLNLVSLPPPMEAVTAKPTLFDISLNSMEFPNLAERKRKEKPAASGGGWFSSWFGGEK